jgi:hypothetical protein
MKLDGLAKARTFEGELHSFPNSGSPWRGGLGAIIGD